ncbi:MAG: Type 1 glutamine amidotransferase-like domain-containing protein [Clostridia bacterium]|nr:Type 1 glutamine amidotransferase-like domain-containing protein [Clostridia bacterium]
MILCLTSSPCDDDVPQGCGLPCIFFRRNAFVDNLRRHVRPSGRFLAIAAWKDDHARNDEMASTFAGCFAFHGMGFSKVEVLDSRTADRAADMVANSDVILLAGGHVPTQNAFFRELGLRALLADYPGVVMGVSAGSMNAADVVYAQPEEAGEAVDPAYQRFLPGLGLTQVNILPHYNMVRDNVLDGMRLFEDITFRDSFGQRFIVLEDGSYVLQEDGQATLWGRSWLIRDGDMSPLCAEEESILL